jgi:hypothetical protein
MNKLITVLLCFILSIDVNAQKPAAEIYEDYTKPKSYTWVNGDEYHNRVIENGLYIGKHGRVLPAKLEFPYEISGHQGDFNTILDMEFTIVKVVGKPTDFIYVHIYTNSETPYLNFAYNEMGDWKLGGHLFEQVYQSGKAQVNSGTNVVRIEYRFRKLSYFLNGIKVIDFEFKEPQRIKWKDVFIESMRGQKTVIALDKMILKAYKTDRLHLHYDWSIKKLGFVDDYENIVIPVIYDNVTTKRQYSDCFSEGLAEVQLNGKWGFIDKFGKEVISTIYDDVSGYSEALAAVKLNGRWGFIDKTGKVAVAIKYDYVRDFLNGFAVVYSGKKQGLINKTGKEVIVPKYKYIGDISEGMMKVLDAESLKMGYADTSGIEVVKAEYMDARDFSGGYAAVQQYQDEGFGYNNWGFIDKTGKKVIPCKYSDVGVFSNGLCSVRIGSKENGKYGFINKEGQEITEIEFEYVYPFTGNVTLVRKAGGKHLSLMDNTGKIIMETKYTYCEGGFSEGVAVVKIVSENFEGYTIINEAGKEIIPVGNWMPVHAECVSDGMICYSDLEDPTKRGFMDITGKKVIPCIYDKAKPFRNGMAEVKLNDKWFYIDKTGKQL